MVDQSNFAKIASLRFIMSWIVKLWKLPRLSERATDRVQDMVQLQP